MLARCIEQMTARSCGTCARRDDCSFVLPEALGFLLSSVGRSPESAERPEPTSRPFLNFLGHVAKGVARNQKRRRRPLATPLRDRVERELEPLLDAGQPRIEDIAGALGYSRQTLYRRLKAEGATFEEVLDELRHRIALRLVRDEGLSVKEAAWRLGYSDPAAFSRAFKRWTGASPNNLKGRKPH